MSDNDDDYKKGTLLEVKFGTVVRVSRTALGEVSIYIPRISESTTGCAGDRLHSWLQKCRQSMWMHAQCIQHALEAGAAVYK